MEHKMGKDTCINIIYDDRQSEDYGRLLGEFIQQNITHYKFWNAIINKDSVVSSINASQKMIVNYARDMKLPFVVLAEQDLMFSSPNSWEYFIKNIPQYYDIYLGGSYLTDNRFEYKAPLVKVDKYVGHHLIIVHEKYYDTFLAADPNDHIDTAQGGKGDFYVCFPYAALQRAGYSANNKAIVNYNNSIPQEFIYK